MTNEQRLVKLERKCRILTLLLVAFGGIICLAAASAPNSAKSTTLEELTASQITLVDKTGRKRIILDADAAGDAGLVIADPAGNIRVSLSATKDDAGMLLFDRKRRNRVALNTDGGDNAEVCLVDIVNKQRVFLFTRGTSAGISLHGAERNPALTLVNTGSRGVVGYGDITRDEGFAMAYDHEKSAGFLKVGQQRLVME
jgi:hypothetical protein